MNAVPNKVLPDDLFDETDKLWPKSSLSKHYKFYPYFIIIHAFSRLLRP